MNYKDTFIRIFVELSRILIGVVFIFSGFVKAVDPVGFALKIEEYLVSFGVEALKSFNVLLAFNLCAIEFVLGVCILLGVYRKFATILTMIFMLFMTPLTLYLAIFDPVSDCGCFGDAVIISNWETFYKNVVLLAASIFLFIYNQRIFQLFTFKSYWFVALYSYLFCVGFAYVNYYHLPVIDFRPYKVGINIPEAMRIPEGAPQDEYRFSFIYEKEGVQQEFTLENYPANDSTWTFVDSKTELIKKGYTPSIESFSLYDKNGDDVGEEILYNPAGTFLLIMSKIEKASDERIDEINDVYDYAVENNHPFYAVTGSSEEIVSYWSDRTGAEYPFLYGDETVLKTIIRSNPGLVYLKEGTILMKWHYKDIPEEEEIDKAIQQIEENPNYTQKQKRRLTTIFLSFIVPLLLVWVYDYFKHRRKRKKLLLHI